MEKEHPEENILFFFYKLLLQDLRLTGGFGLMGAVQMRR